MVRRRVKYLSQLIQKRLHISEYTLLVLLSLIVGVIVGAVACIFRMVIHETAHLLFKNPDLFGITSRYGIPSALVRPFLPAMGGLVVGLLIYKLLKIEGGHGVPSVIKSVATGVMSFRSSMAVKSATSAVIMGTGGSAGPEGPIVEIGSVIGAQIGKLLGISRANLGILVGCGAAAGLSAVFDAPIGAVFFVLELILPYVSIRVFSPVILSSITGGVVAREVLGRNPAFDVPSEIIEQITIHPFDLFLFAVLGLWCAILSWVFIMTMDRVQGVFAGKRQMPMWLKPAIGGFLVGLLGIIFHDVMGEGYDLVGAMLIERPAFLLLLFLPLAKILATSFSLGSGGTGGIFAPAMVTGAMGGALFGSVVAVMPIVSGVPAGVFILVGMGGVVAGMLNAPLAGMFIIFEVTGGSYELLVPLMVAVTVTVLVTRWLQKRASVYTLSLLRDGFDIDSMRQPDPLLRTNVDQAMHTQFLRLRPEMPLKDIIDLVADTDQSAFPVINSRGLIMGVISISDLRAVLSLQRELGSGLIAGDICDTHPPLLLPGSTLKQASHIFGGSNVEGIPVVKPGAPRVVIGMLYRGDVFESYKKHGEHVPF